MNGAAWVGLAELLVLALILGVVIGQRDYRRMILRSGLLTKEDLEAACYLSLATRRRKKEARHAKAARYYENRAAEHKSVFP